ncbi:hypothetical protein AB0A60_02820 [Streptomyces sp. NPDC046275]|uniref:hypothetical protein n=1 Tax=Streptomyces sp. NPDC046275 TaxID=3157201 RepID=UPI0033E0883F
MNEETRNDPTHGRQEPTYSHHESTTHYYGPVAHTSGSGNVGFQNVTFHAAPQQDAALRAALDELTGLLEDLRASLTPDEDRRVVAVLPLLRAGGRAELARNVPALADVAATAAGTGPAGAPAARAAAAVIRSVVGGGAAGQA